MTEQQLASSQILKISDLEKRLVELKMQNYRVAHVDLYGGEIGLLDEKYLSELDALLGAFDNPSVNVITNFYKINPYFLKDHISLSVSYDFQAREKHEQVFNNILKTDKVVAILMLASPELINYDVEQLITMLNQAGNITSVEIKPYSPNQANNLKVSYSAFEDFIKKWIVAKTLKKFRFINEDLVKQSLASQKNAFSDDHVYITPNGKFAVLEFDQEQNEFFLELNHLSEYIDWHQKERQRVISNFTCASCNYLGHCLTEHYRDVLANEESCNGFRGILNWYSNTKTE